MKKSLLLLGAVAMAIAIPSGVSAVSAASPTPTVYTYTQLANQNGIDLNSLLQQYSQGNSQNGIDLNALLQQYLQGNNTFVTKPSTQSGNVTKHPKRTGIVTKHSKGTGSTAKPSTGTGTTTKPSTGSGTGTVASTSAFATEVVTLVNQERAKAGLGALAANNSKLTNMALDKAKDMYNNNYFDHNSPTYGSPFDMMKKYGINFSYAGENIAKGQRTPQEVMTAWMNSSGHRANILNANYTTIGVAYYNGEWVQEFIS
jgi:uncharacterized YkwD family protein